MNSYRHLTALIIFSGLAACSGTRSTVRQVTSQSVVPPTPILPESPVSPPEADEPMAQPPSPESSAPASPDVATTSCMAPDAASKTKNKPKRPAKPAENKPTAAPTVAGSSPARSGDVQVQALGESVMSILGKQVHGATGEDLGRVVDVLADQSGRVRIAVIDFGGFLGVGDRRIAVDWPLLRFNPGAGDTSVLLSVSRDQLKSAPEYKEGPHPQILMLPPSTASVLPEQLAAPAYNK
jgi:hypothetical protein